MQTISVPYVCLEGDRSFPDNCRRLYSAAVRTAYANAHDEAGKPLKQKPLRNLVKSRFAGGRPDAWALHCATLEGMDLRKRAPDGRMVFGGRVQLGDSNPRLSSLKLHAQMTRLFPELGQTRITHGWMGFVAYTFDTLPHLGRTQDGLYYCMGYCGSGVSLASYFGTRIGQQIAGKTEGRTGLDGITFQTRPLYTGTPWFLPASIAWYKLRDSLNV